MKVWELADRPAPRSTVKENLEQKTTVNKVTHCGTGLMVDRRESENPVLTMTSLVEDFGWYTAMVDVERNNWVIMPLNESGIGDSS